MIGVIVSVVAGIIAILFILKERSTKRPPGPGFIGGFSKLVHKVGKTVHLLSEWNDTFGPMFSIRLISVWLYVCSDCELIEEVYTNTRQTQTRGINGIRYFIPESLLGLENCDAQWKEHRKIVSGAFTDMYLKQYSEEIISVGNDLIQRLKKDGLIADINEVMATLTYVVLSNTVMGKSWAEMFSSAGTKEQLQAALITANTLTNVPVFLWNWVTFKSKTMATAHCANMRAALENHIHDIKANNTQGTSMLHFLAHHPAGLSDREIVDELLSLTMAGHETTANALSFALVCLAQHPDIQRRAQEEIRALKEPLAYNCISKLPLIWAIFKETLRLFPTVPINARMAEQDMTLGGYRIPKDTRILVNTMHMCRNEKYFEHAMSFDPDRWMGAGSSAADMERRTFVFGGGLRVCIGRRFAEEEGILLLALLLNSFQVSVEAINHQPPNITRVTDIPTVAHVTLTFEHPVSLRFTPL